MKTANFLEDLKAEIGDEHVESVSIGCWAGYTKHEKHLDGKLLSWEEAKPILDYEYEPFSYGRGKCHSIYIWTEKRIIFVVSFDGYIMIKSIPRNPIAGLPETPGLDEC